MAETKMKRNQRADRANDLLDRLTRERRQDNIETFHVHEAMHGVTVGTLAQIFRMDPATVRKRLKDCAPISTRKAGHVYDLATAAQFLVKPVFNIEEYMRTMKPSELPTHLQEQYWSAQNKKRQWEEQAGHLWRTEAVLEVLGDLFQTIKFAIQLWPDTVERSTSLSPEQRALMVEMGDGLQAEIHSKLLELPMKKKTEPLLAENRETIEPANDDDFADLI